MIAVLHIYDLVVHALFSCASMIGLCIHDMPVCLRGHGFVSMRFVCVFVWYLLLALILRAHDL